MKSFPSIDNDLLLDDGNTYTATQNIGQVNAGNAVIDLGADYARYPEFQCVTYLGTLDDANADETYQINLRFASDSGITADVVDHELDVANSASNTVQTIATSAKQRYVAVQFVLGGTTPSMQILNCQLTGLN